LPQYISQNMELKEALKQAVKGQAKDQKSKDNKCGKDKVKEDSSKPAHDGEPGQGA